ncbi:T6SS phospholipase effector Tle1-like catalytic domain-containing protein [Micromonospora rhizosphaerae]|uniref:T6SS phospholipase effector Tle1-like catalytic domain-containing protein n=1 Tax=Micromonospora rhizosphaerae TaxID=568872 RepID=UPI000B80D1D8|nr:DUF2235 domain-containing protein [Micromonospora rhizosphaerae]
MSRNLVVCLDGTRNEPETGTTNVIRLYRMAAKSDNQLVYYGPGVGTMGARSATTRFGKTLTRAAGLIVGDGVKENIEEAYRFLMENYQPNDRIFIFGGTSGRPTKSIPACPNAFAATSAGAKPYRPRIPQVTA